MSKFATVLLKILMVISFVAIIVFVAFAIITNQNISFEAYNYISSSYESTSFDDFAAKVNVNVKTSYNGAVDPYAKYINEAVVELNKGNKLFLNYLAVEDNLTKGEQDKLRSLYGTYYNRYKTVENAYEDYMIAYEDADYQYLHDYSNSSVALSVVISKCVYFVERYTDCYVAGSEFFKYLVDVVNRYSFNDTSCFSFKEQSYLIKVGIVDHSTGFVYSNMQNKRDNKPYETNLSNNDLIDSFYDFLEREFNFDDTSLVTNASFESFVCDLNCLNIYEFSGNYEQYLNSLRREEEISKCELAHEFFVSNFRG